MKVRPAGSSEPFTILNPRQQLRPAPLAHTLRPGAVISGTVQEASVLNLYNGRGGGLAVDATGRGLTMNAAGVDGVYVETAVLDGVRVNSAGDDGVPVTSAGGDGLHIESASNGVAVNSATDDGRFVQSASNGVHVASADVGVAVDSASSGVYVGSADHLIYLPFVHR